MCLKILARAWAAPYSALGLLLGLLVMLFGARVQKRQGVLEFGGRPYLDNRFEREACAKAAWPGCN